MEAAKPAGKRQRTRHDTAFRTEAVRWVMQDGQVATRVAQALGRREVVTNAAVEARLYSLHPVLRRAQLALVQAYRALPAAQRYGITTWNVADAGTWLRSECGCPEWPLPFDDNYAKKPAYAGIVAALQ